MGKAYIDDMVYIEGPSRSYGLDDLLEEEVHVEYKDHSFLEGRLVRSSNNRDYLLFSNNDIYVLKSDLIKEVWRIHG